MDRRFTLVALATFCSLLVLVKTAAAQGFDDDPTWGSTADALDAAPHELWIDGASTGSLWVSLAATFGQRASGKNEFGAMMLLGVPLERLAQDKPRHPPAVAEPANKGVDRPAPPPPPGGTPNAGAVEEASAIDVPRLVTPAMARGAVDAAFAHGKLGEEEARLGRIASRARASALLPELRLRVTRQLDEAQALSPTQYDPDRVTATGGASLWLEARATFRLDKLVFADEEIALEKLRDERALARQKLAQRVLEALFAWQRARVVEADPGRDVEERTRAAVAALEAEATLDVLTGGWFSKAKERGSDQPKRP
jgi:hypothetical protein